MSALTTVIAVLPETPENVPHYLTSCHLIVSMMTNNENFPAPTPPLEEVSTSLKALAADEELAQKGGKGMVKQRDVTLRQSHRSMTLLKAYVQSTANAEPDRAEAIVLSAGMNIAKPRTWAKLPTSAKHGRAPGSIVLDAKALPKPVQYRWQMSTDQEIWTDLPETFNTKKTVEGLVPSTVYSFRLRTVTKHGPSEWSSPISIMAH